MDNPQKIEKILTKIKEFLRASLWFFISFTPEWLINFFVTVSIRDRLRKERRRHKKVKNEEKSIYEKMAEEPIALAVKQANAQHYEVPTQFFQLVLGKHLKYSSCYYEGLIYGSDRLSQAEEEMLRITVQRAGVANQQNILELGCGWGSLSLYMASRFPRSQIFSVSNSRTQKAFIDGEAHRRGIKNLHVIVADMNDFNPLGAHKKIKKNGKTTTLPLYFDRIVSVEMFEHMRNYEKLLEQISAWLKPREGQLFVHIFAHKQFTYFFNDDEQAGSSWMARHFFSFGVMPAFNIFSHFEKDMEVKKSWKINGKNYGHTAHDWVLRHRAHRKKIVGLFKNAYGKLSEAYRRWFYWQLFFIACRELFSWKNGEEWMVGHYTLKPHEKFKIR